MSDSPSPLSIVAATSLSEELSRAGHTYQQAARLLDSLLANARHGLPITLSTVKPVVESITSSVLRNSDALMTLCRLQQGEDETLLHSLGVGVMMVVFGKSLGLDLATLHQFALGGLLHDIGKTKVAPEILDKPSRLSDEEMRYLKSHVVQGAAIARQLPGISKMALEIIEQHHERYDGSGYPRGLCGEAIAYAGRVAAIVDVYDTITSRHAYRQQDLPGEALEQLFSLSAAEFDPGLIEAFVRCIGVYPVGSLVRLHSGRLAVVTGQNAGEQLLQPQVRIIYDSLSRSYLPPLDVDLALAENQADAIVASELAASWGIDPLPFIVG
jgi:putative nucleotidyltransferase with HDIG domain